MTNSANCDSPDNRLLLGSTLLAEHPGNLDRLTPMPPEDPDELVRRFLPGEER